MIHWGWAIGMVVLAFYFGFFIAALCAVAGRDNNASGSGKNCNNCHYKNRTNEQHIIARCNRCRESNQFSYGWQPDYQTLEAELQQYKQALERALPYIPETKYSSQIRGEIKELLEAYEE